MVAKASKSAKVSPKQAGRGRPPTSGGIVKPKDDGVKKVVKYAFKAEDNLQIYIYRLLKQVHPEVGVSRSSMTVINKMVLEIYKKLGNSASELSKHHKQKSLTARDVQAAVKLTVPGEL